MPEKLISNALETTTIATTVNSRSPRPPANSIVNLLKFNESLFSVELCPERAFNLDILKKLRPKFCSVTWRSNNYVNCDVKDIAPISLAENLRCHGFEVLLHLAGKHLKKDRALTILERVKEIGVTDLLVLQGGKNERIHNLIIVDDESSNLENGDFKYSSDLMKFIKKEFSDYFSLGVAAYPDQSKDEIKYLVEKVSLGASYIVTNGSLSTSSYELLLSECRQHNIKIPIIPGVFIISNYNMLIRISELCKVPIPNDILVAASKNKENPELFKEFGINRTQTIIKDIVERKLFDCVHIFSLNNLELVETVLENYNSVDD